MNHSQPSAATIPSLAEIMDFVRQEEKRDYACRVSLSFLRNFTIDSIAPFIHYHNYRAGIATQIRFGAYDNINQEILDQDSHLYTNPGEIIVVAIMREQLRLEPSWDPAQAIVALQEIYTALATKTSALIIINNFIAPFYSPTGFTNVPQALDLNAKVEAVNQALRTWVRQHPHRFFLVDWSRLMRICGEQGGMDYRFWYMARAPFSKNFLYLYALEISKIVKALKGRSKKCLVVDADNTLWGGIIGEDGIDGIALDPNTYPGNVYYDFQRTLLALQSRGILLALCSKNNEEDVWQVLQQHHHCLLQRHHLAAYRINWQNKADNIAALAAELNLGLDSLVFVDDSPGECELVRTALPQVTVLPVPGQRYLYPRLLLQEGLFDTLYLSDEDQRRTEMYRAQHQRQQQRQSCVDIDSYLASLQMAVAIERDARRHSPRIAQLTQKTNQFNLTTRRYSQGQIEAFMTDPAMAVFNMAVQDKFGDLGLTAVLIARRQGELGVIDSLLLSCRILGRRLETVFLHYCLQQLEQSWPISAWEAEYLATAKNRQTADFWNKQGFTLIAVNATGASYRLEVTQRKSPQLTGIRIE